MKIRSLTYFDSPGYPLDEAFLKRVEVIHKEVPAHLSGLGFEIQTIRFASPPFPLWLGHLPDDSVIEYALQLEKLLVDLGFDYLALGPAQPGNLASYQLIPDLIRETQATFCSGGMTDPTLGLSLPGVRACGQVIERLAPLDPNGFANLYFAALGNVPPGAPFFPAAYHDGGDPAFAVAVEAADLAVSAFSGAGSLIEARTRLVGEIERTGKKITGAARSLERATGAVFQGIDYSLAPFPEADLSIGTALERLGIEGLGLHGSLAAAAFLADTIDQADFFRTGFSGLMLPVLEDAVLAERAAEGTLGIKDLLLYSAVCGTGLDTVPLPGDSTGKQISAVLMDLASLSLRLDKPLTARLMPIPGKQAGDPTNFDFPFFANSRVLALEAAGLEGLFSGEEMVEITPRLSNK